CSRTPLPARLRGLPRGAGTPTFIGLLRQHLLSSSGWSAVEGLAALSSIFSKVRKRPWLCRKFWQVPASSISRVDFAAKGLCRTIRGAGAFFEAHSGL